MMKLLASIFILIGCISGYPQKAKKQVLVFYKTEGFHHESVATARTTIQELGKEHNFEVKSTKNTNDFLGEKLKIYDLVVFANTTGDVFNEEQQVAFQTYIENGGNLFGIHSAADTEGEWPFFVELVGGYFESHPEIQEAHIKVNKSDHPSVAHLPQLWKVTEEWYNYKNLQPELKVLLYLDEASYEGGTNGKEHPIAWFQETGYGGLSIYTGLGHSMELYKDPNFREHLLQSILFAIGEVKN